MNENYRVNLEPIEVSLRGYNWGNADFDGSQLQFSVSGKTAFELPLQQIANTSQGAKNEVAIEFIPPVVDPNGPKRQREDTLVEIRFYVPGNVTAGQVQELDQGKYQLRDKADVDAVDPEEVDEEGEISLAAQKVVNGPDGEPLAASTVFCDTIKAKIDADSTSSEAIVHFEELLCLTPRGRFQVHMHASFLRLRGKSHDYKILYTSIKRLFLVPKPDDLHRLFVIGLDPPLRQGQTRYPHLVFQFEREDEVELELNLSDDLWAEKYKDSLQKSYDGPVYQVLSDIFVGLVGKKVLGPSMHFQGAIGQGGVKCSQKANEAILYPLEKAFLSIPKPAIYIPFSEIAAVTFSRATNSSTKTFEMKFNLTSGTEYSFSSIAREEYSSLESFCLLKKLPIRNEIGDEGMGGFGSSDDEDNDQGRKRAQVDYQDGFDASESDDDDFRSGSDSDVEEEFNEDYESSEDGEEGEPNHEPKEEEKPKKARKKEVSEDKPKKKQKKDPNAPKRAMSAFLYFSQEYRAKVMAEQPNLPIGEIAKILGARWKELSEADKAVICTHLAF